eukprot:12760250-Alexandrium_andersonii.AAC.1
MSASLVGSEMCIRDRCTFCHLRRAPTGALRARPETDGPPRGLPHAPVSYTHLTLPTICSV